ncbi:MAG TPA: ABC transporter ATP-binding protein [Chthoniobacterales bacterium]|nr:ABC transporter ATP-binding protein [Chthoniobacterales bacterium]
MAKVSLKHVSQSSLAGHGGDVAVLRDLDLEIANREFVAVTGAAGCGKTTLLRLIAGLEKPGQGEITIGDRTVNDLKASERDVALVFPQDALYPEMSVRENIAFGLRLRKFSKTEIARRVEDAAGVIGIESLLAQRPRELSGEERQRVSLARAISRQPQVLLFDEPLANFETGRRAEMRMEIRKLHERLQTTVIYATRDPSEAMAMGERVIVLGKGGVQQFDPPERVYDQPANMFVAGFLGSPPTNFLRGTLKLERDVILFSEAEEGTVRARFPLSERPAAGEFVGKEIVLGIRPEDIEIVSAGKGNENAGSFPAVIDLVETTGDERILYLQTGAHTVASRRRATAEAEPAGRRVRFQFDLGKAHFFDPISGLRMADL